ncbi:hypothetical protein COCNU_01G019550 [Cocos nucifera]|uniref:Uncharacterized protein n=1 Tax=Cocos nucifera TaxID=13894 RepID=A0A8K0HWZ6_COCNU|nr:hypothetical protein COCNU_01G019550 [Cocos nucifera]
MQRPAFSLSSRPACGSNPPTKKKNIFLCRPRIDLLVSLIAVFGMDLLKKRADSRGGEVGMVWSFPEASRGFRNGIGAGANFFWIWATVASGEVRAGHRPILRLVVIGLNFGIQDKINSACWHFIERVLGGGVEPWRWCLRLELELTVAGHCCVLAKRN